MRLFPLLESLDRGTRGIVRYNSKAFLANIGMKLLTDGMRNVQKFPPVPRYLP